jgi:hypothetical protein
MPLDKWRLYASKNRLEQKGYLKKRCHRGESGKATKASDSNSVQQSREEQEKELRDRMLWYGKEIVLTEPVVFTGENHEENRESQVGETHQQGRPGISLSDQGRSEVEEVNIIKTKGKKMKKPISKEKKHEAKESKAYEKKEDKKEKSKKK